MAVTHPYPAGTRVRNYGQQWAKARESGTAVVLESVEQPDKTFEYRVRKDDGEETWWASYRTELPWNTRG